MSSIFDNYDIIKMSCDWYNSKTGELMFHSEHLSYNLLTGEYEEEKHSQNSFTYSYNMLPIDLNKKL